MVTKPMKLRDVSVLKQIENLQSIDILMQMQLLGH